VKHATASALDRLTGLLTDLRRFEPLREKLPGVFYCRSRAFLHFHEDAAGVFADLRTGSGWERMPVNSKDEQAKLISRIRRHFATPAS